MTARFAVTLAELEALTTHAAVASSAAADDNKRREREAWAQFDAVIDTIRNRPLEAEQ